jgi:uncharacterized protein YbjQ (UPF0145 family)
MFVHSVRENSIDRLAREARKPDAKAVLTLSQKEAEITQRVRTASQTNK